MNKHERPPEVNADTVIELSDCLSIVLADDRRQHLLSILSSSGDPQTIRDLAASIEVVSPNQRTETSNSNRLTLGLHHCHLPKLADFGLIEYDPDQLEARITPKGEKCLEIFGEMLNA